MHWGFCPGIHGQIRWRVTGKSASSRPGVGPVRGDRWEEAGDEADGMSWEESVVERSEAGVIGAEGDGDVESIVGRGAPGDDGLRPQA